MRKHADDRSRAPHMPFEFCIQLRNGEARRQFLGVEIGGNDHENIMKQHIRPRAGARVSADLAADKFVRWLAEFTLREGIYIRWNAGVAASVAAALTSSAAPMTP